MKKIILSITFLVITIQMFGQSRSNKTIIVLGYEKVSECSGFSNATYYMYQTCNSCTYEETQKMESDLVKKVKSYLGSDYKDYMAHKVYEGEAWAIIEAKAAPAFEDCTYTTYILGKGSSTSSAIENAKKNMLSYYKYNGVEVSKSPL